ncbi:hypothetical protein V2G26_020759 [Clonostachys chloroleuca]
MNAAVATQPAGQAPLDLGITLPLGSAGPDDECRIVVEDEYDDVDDEANLQESDEIEDQDGAQAVLQPAMSATASHLASPRTPAVEKAAALEKWPGGILGIPPPIEDDSGDNDDGTTVGDPNSPIAASLGSPVKAPPLCESPEPTSPAQFDEPALEVKVPETKPGREPAKTTRAPSSSEATPNDVSGPNDGFDKPINRPRRRQSTRSRHSIAILDSAFTHSRERSRSAGQDALRRLQKAFPSLSSPSHLLPSLPSNFFSAFGEKSPSTVPAPKQPLQRPVHSPIPEHPSDNRLDGQIQSSFSPRPDSIRRSNSIRSPQISTQSRPGVLRRVTSDDSLLYHTLSRTSSLGNDEQFHDVRDMVNMRFQAIKESLPEVPNFKMPSLAKLHTPSFISLNSMDMRSQETPTFAPANRSPKLNVGSGGSKDGPATLDDVLADLTGDIVIMGGLRGSVLRSAKPPHQQVWAPVKIGLNMRKVNLEIGLDDEAEERMEETIIPSGMLSHMGPVDMSRKLFRKLRSCNNVRNGTLRVWDYGYDWRLSPHILSRKLQEFLAKLPSNKPGTPPESRGALLIAHSMGGLIARHAVNQQPNLFSGVMFAGTPQRCINILGPIRNGDVILFNEKLLSAQVNFTIRSYYVFLPEDGSCFVDKNTGEPYPVDFYNPQEWIKWHLCPSVQPPLPPFNQPIGPSSSTSSFTSFLPTSLRARAESLSEKRFSMNFDSIQGTTKDRTIAPQMQSGAERSTTQSSNTTSTGDVAPTLSDPELKRNMEYLTRTLARTKKFRSELAHSSEHQAANAYPPLGVLYGKTTPTVYAAQVNGREAIRHSDAYDDLLFRPGDGVVLAKEAMLPEGYSIVKGGRVSTERGHITMLGDLGAVGQVLAAIVKGRRKGIGYGKKKSESA